MSATLFEVMSTVYGIVDNIVVVNCDDNNSIIDIDNLPSEKFWLYNDYHVKKIDDADNTPTIYITQHNE